MEIEVLSAALVLVASLCGGLSCVYIARGRSSINKHSRQRIKDFENDIKYLAESKKEEAKDYRQEILRLKGTINKQKQGVTVSDNDMKNSGLDEIIMQMVPKRYRSLASLIVPQIKEAVKKDPTLIDKAYEKIKSANSTNSQQTESGSQTQGIQTL